MLGRSMASLVTWIKLIPFLELGFLNDSGDEEPNPSEGFSETRPSEETGARSKETAAEKEKPKPGTENTTSAEDDRKDSAFECNICLDVASEAVISMCGHLFCWPCLHQWLETRFVFHF